MCFEYSQGGKETCPTKLNRWRGSGWRRHFVYPLLLATAVKVVEVFRLLQDDSSWQTLELDSVACFAQVVPFYLGSRGLELCTFGRAN